MEKRSTWFFPGTTASRSGRQCSRRRLPAEARDRRGAPSGGSGCSRPRTCRSEPGKAPLQAPAARQGANFAQGILTSLRFQGSARAPTSLDSAVRGLQWILLFLGRDAWPRKPWKILAQKFEKEL